MAKKKAATKKPPAELDDAGALDKLARSRDAILGELSKVIVGQQETIQQVLIALLCRGHCLLEGVPGLAKTLLVSTLAQVLELEFHRIQFTPDLMPADILGTEILEEDPDTRTRAFRFIEGPIFANLVLADEINRTPPKTQAALLEAMQEKQVSAGGQIRPLPRPFFVLATQNPIEQEGTYPLPEAQLDRFMFNTVLGYPTPEDEFEIYKRASQASHQAIEPVLTAEDFIPLQQFIARVPVCDAVLTYARDLVGATRAAESGASKLVQEYVGWGAGPRAGLCMIQGAKARTALDGRPTASIEDVKALAVPTLRHRIVLNFKADADNISKDELIAQLAEEVAAGS